MSETIYEKLKQLKLLRDIYEGYSPTNKLSTSTIKNLIEKLEDEINNLLKKEN
jgi:hypothetical protein